MMFSLFYIIQFNFKWLDTLEKSSVRAILISKNRKIEITAHEVVWKRLNNKFRTRTILMWDFKGIKNISAEFTTAFSDGKAQLEI
jgi:hypothetical protein